MIKSFTRLFSIFLLIAVFVLQGFGVSVTFPDLEPSTTLLNHKKTDTFVLTTSEKVVPGVGVIRLKEGVTTLNAYQATNPNVTITEKADGTCEIVVNFTSNLLDEKTYTLEADANFVKAADDAAASNIGSWTVHTGDYTVPVLATTAPLSPVNGASTAIQLDQNLTVKFNEDVKIATDGKFYIYEDNGTAFGNLFEVVEGAALSVAGSTVTINPVKTFKELTKYYVVIPAGAVVDAADTFANDNMNKFAGWLNNTTWAFTTRDATAPAVTKFTTDNIAKDAFDVFVQLDKKGKVYVLAVAKDATAPVAADFISANGMKEAAVTAAATDVKLSLTQFFNGTATAMTEGGSYDVYVLTENAETVTPTQSAPAKKLTVTTSDVTKPTITALYPLAGELNSDVNEKNYLTIKLSEKVKIGTGSVSIYTWNNTTNHELLVSVPASALKVSKIAGVTEKDSLYIPVDKSLWVSSTTYYVNYSEGIVADLAQNKLAAVTTTEGWKFKVQDFLAPTYTIVPLNGTTGVSQVAPQVTITFNEPLYKDATGTSVMDVAGLNAALSLKKGTTVATFTPAITGNVVTLTITPSVASNDVYELSIDTKKIFDLSGNVGTTVDKVTFTIKDFESPVVTVEPLLPGKSDNILIKFNEPVFNADGSAITDAAVANMVIFRKGTTAAGAIVNATYTVAADAKSFIINPANDFTTPGDQYYVRLGAGAVEDAAGNANALAEQVIAVADFIAPTAELVGVGTSPIAPPASTAVQIKFSEPLETLAGTAIVTGDATSFVNLKENGENVSFTAAWNLTTPANPTIVITYPYTFSKTYTISVGKSLQDVSNNLFEGITESFTTWSNAAPAMVSVAPVAAAKEQANNVALTVTFDQPVVAGAGTITLGGTSATVGSVTIDGAVLTIAHTAFANDQTITVTVPAGFVNGINGLPSSVVSWTFNTHETVAPTVATYLPAIASTTASVSEKLKLTFSEEVVERAGQILIKDFATDVTVQTLTEANTAVNADDKKILEITLPTALAYNKQYYVVITEGFVEDVAANKYAGISGNSWNFTTVATPGAFTVASSVPADGADKIAAGINSITVTFNRDIKPGSLSAVNKITLNDGSANVITDVANSSRFSISGNTLTINTLSDIVANKTYTLTLDGGIVTDTYNTANTGKTIVFYTKDNNAPKVASHTPAKDATNVAVNTTIVLNWDELPRNIDNSAILAADIKTKSIVLVGGSNAYTASINGQQWTLTLDAPLAEKTAYTVSVDLDQVEDANDIAGSSTPYTWTFTTLDATCNAPTAFVVTEDTKGTEIKFTVTFDEKGAVYYAVLPSATTAPTAAEVVAMNKTIAFAGPGTLTSAAQTVTGLTSGASYKAYFVAVDASANQSTVYAPVAFTTKDVVAPSVTAMVPATGTVDVAANTTTTPLKLTYNETVIKGAGFVVIRKVTTDERVASIDVTSGSVVLATTEGKTTATVTPGVTLDSKTAYYVEVSTGAFTDAALNKSAGISGSATWTFTTKDTVSPLMVKTSPADAEVPAVPTPEIAVGTTLSIEFNEEMKAPTGVAYVKFISNDAVFEVINANAITLSADKKTMSLHMVNVPTEQTEFYVDLADLGLKDLADNAWVNVLNTKNWNFIVLDQTAPVLASSVPANNATMVAITTPIVLTFSEAIFKAPNGSDFDGTAAKIADVVSLKDAAGNTVELATVNPVTIDLARKVVTITPKNALVSESVYKVYVSPVVDNRKNVSNEIVVTFTTKDNTAPFVSAGNWNPAFDTTMNPKTGVVTVTFNEPVYDEVTITSENNAVVIDVVNANIVDFFTYNVGTVTRDGNGDIASFTAGTAVSFTGTISADKKSMVLTPVAAALPLTSEAWYQVVLKPGVVEDLGDNGNVTSNTVFQVEDHVKPTVTLYAPQGATAATTEMKITFNEPVKVGAGSFFIRNYVDGTLIEEVAANATNVTVDGTSVVVKHADFPANMNFYVNADAGVITDVAGNAWAGIETAAINTWKFSTADAVVPVLFAEGALLPEPGAVNVSLNTELNVIFSKAVSKNVGNIVIYNEDWTPFQVIPVSAVTMKAFTDPVYQADRIASIPHDEFAPLSKYFVRVEAGTFKDAANNSFAGLLDNTWFFTTEDNGAPEIVSTTPADNATAVGISDDLVITFDRDVLANGAGKVIVYEEVGNTGVMVESISTTDATKVTIAGPVVTINRATALKYNSNYYVIIESGAFTNTASEKKPFAGITTTLGWNFATGADVDAPVFVSMTPNATTVLTDNHPTFVMTFNEDVVLGTGNIKVIKKDGTVPVLTIPVTGAVVAGKTVTVTYVAPTTGGLDKNTEYYVLVDGGIVKDGLGNATAAITDVATWTFKTGADFATDKDPDVNTSLEFKVYPNPFVDFVTVETTAKLSKVIVTNIAGQKVKEVVNPTDRIQLNELRSGVYFISLYDMDNVIAKTAKIIKR
jgi:methionine-rich copper-binding protein CopC